MDWPAIITAAAAAIPIVGGFALQVITYFDTRRFRQEQIAQNFMVQGQLDSVSHAINGNNARQVAMAMRAGTAEGHAAGLLAAVTLAAGVPPEKDST